MPNFLLKRWYGYRTVWVFALMMLMTISITVYNWPLGLLALCLAFVVVFVMLRAELKFRRELAEYTSSLSYRVHSIEGEIVSRLPLGLMLYDAERTIEWHNRQVVGLLGIDTAIGMPLSELLPGLPPLAREKKDGSREPLSEVKTEIEIGPDTYMVIVYPEERMVYLQKMTEMAELRARYEQESLSLGILMLDNLDEAVQGMDDQQRTLMVARATSLINSWARQYDVYLRRLSSERYMMLLNQASLEKLEQSRFVILDEVREATSDLKVPMTLSIGLACGNEKISELGALAQSSLDMALGRGGDQAAVKAGQRLSFYGGRSNAVEKRTRVRARVIAHALRDLMKRSDRVLIMGHKNPDMDVIGAAIGMLKAAEKLDVEAGIVLSGDNPSIEKMMERIRGDATLADRFIPPEEALSLMTERTLLVVVDTHKQSMTIEPKLVQRAKQVVVIDHHRRSEEFINDAVIVYLEPYASSASELVTELLQYIHDNMTLTPLESTALLAGITVDTKHFALHTGSRTFEAAGFLRRSGADTVLVQRMLKEDLDEYISKAEIIKHARVVLNGVAIAVTGEGRQFPQLLIAQAADTLLNMTDVNASFVIGSRPDGLTAISARSFGKINVQVVMERLGGGGHLTNAAVQLDISPQEAEKKLLAVLEDIEKEEGLFE
ncbi:DHH family phosphoesterase [Saccharibacillus sp. CPCC 101409]|uniref:DHH family phosphoesterase n=1 Tax=Saccharibacillus sp. CPCC 101409 TaxID=3058041 RepID=UPI002672BD32|nr:DHH family phosphoesterase [Saccharibacillus sp. CPCC 101409]MDO3413247.1 DHH family phosphoesterase [Saccharibacillus sp. CPCC 101409]